MTNLDSTFEKQRHYFANKGPSSQGYGFPVVMYGCESWTMKKAEHRRIDAFKLWCCRRLLRVPWTARRSNQSVLKEISPGISLEGMMLKLKLQYIATSCEELTHWKRLWCWEGLGAGGQGDDRGWDGWMASLTRWTWVWVNSGSWWWTGRPVVLRFMGSQRDGHDWATDLMWSDLKGSMSRVMSSVCWTIAVWRGGRDQLGNLSWGQLLACLQCQVWTSSYMSLGICGYREGHCQCYM